MNFSKVEQEHPDRIPLFTQEQKIQIEIALQYEGYIERQKKEAKKLDSIDAIKIPSGFNFKEVTGISNECKQRLSALQPANLGQTSRVAGVSPADITVLMVAIENFRRAQASCC